MNDDMTSPLSPELQLIILACKAQLEPDAQEKLAEFLEKTQIRWEEVRQLAESNKVRPLVYRGLQRSGNERIPAALLSQLQAECQYIRFYNLYNAQEQLEIIRALEKNGLTAIAYKGPNVTNLAYADIGLRETIDVDLFIRKEELPQIAEVLRRINFKPAESFTKGAAREVARAECEASFDGSVFGKRMIRLELHWMPAHRRYGMVTELAELEPFLVTGSINGQPVHTFSTEMLFVQLCMHHGGVDLWRHLKFCCDLAFLLHRHAGRFNWPVAMQQARRMGVEGICLNGLALLRECFGLSFPLEITQRLNHPRYRQLAAEQIRRFELAHRPALWSHGKNFFMIFGYHLKIRERLSDRIYILLWHIRQVLLPTVEDIQASGLSYPWYYGLAVTKPFRLLRDHFLSSSTR